MISWQEFEKKVRILSGFIWNCNAVNETINGVKFDCVLKPKENYWIVVEVTEDETLAKVRTDIAKFSTCRQFLFSKNIFAEFFLVMRNNPTETMQTTGDGCFVKVLSNDSFSKLFLDYPSYVYARQQKAFGSAVNPLSGLPDNNDYTPVFYQNIKTGRDVKLKDISKCLIEGKRIIMLGNYGTGKSRCIRELFNTLSNKAIEKTFYPIAINLKEHWGQQRADEILRRHFGLLGLSNSVDSLLKIIESNNFIFLLDGFDEIGSQVWSEDTYQLQQIRSSSLSAIKHLISITKSPVIITGREHYFNSNSEMFDILGLKTHETELLQCKEEFSDDEMANYLKSISLAIELPIWLPKRPLICQIINTIEKDELEKIFIDSYSSVQFWNTLIKNICEREARISPKLLPENIYKILKEIANITRTKINNVGPISFIEINKSFAKVVGTSPVDDSAVMLQRLPGLGRVSSENMDRQFIDYYILDGLRADNLIEIVYKNYDITVEENWINPLGKTGIEIVAMKMQQDRSANVFIEYLKKSIASGNKIITGDILASLVFYTKKNTLDLRGIYFEKLKISSMNFSKSLIENFSINNSEITDLDISDCSFSKITIKQCSIKNIYGIEKENDTPSFISDSIIENYILQSMDYDNKLFGLKPSHMMLISIIKKIFFLGMNLKTEDELLNSFGSRENKRIAMIILKLLVKEKIVSKPNSYKQYSPKTFNRERMKEILADLNNSKDPLWIEIGTID